MRPADILLSHARQMGGENHAAGVTRPVHYIERGIVFRKIRVAAIAEDALYEIKVANETGRRKKTCFHRLGRLRACRRAYQGTQEQRYEESDLLFLGGRKRQRQQICWRAQS